MTGAVVQWGDVATWFAAVGTVAAVAAALWQVASERKRRIKRERRSQAALISAWRDPRHNRMGRPGEKVVLLNSSGEPVYNIVVAPVAVQWAAPHRGEDMVKGFRNHKTLSILAPGHFQTSVSSLGGGMGLRWGMEVAFSDRNGH